MLNVLRGSYDAAMAMNHAEMSEYLLIMPAGSGAFPGPEGTAALAAQVGLLDSGWFKSHEAVVLFDTGTPKVIDLLG